MSDSPQSNDTDNSKISSNDIVNNSNTSSSPTPNPTPSVVGKVKSRLKQNPKRNSTNSVWVTRTLSVGHPEISELVKAMGLWMSATLQTTKGKKPKYPQRNYTIFLDEDTSQPEEWPSVDELTYFIGSIVSVGELAAQSCIMAVAYISRIKGKLHIHAKNWRRVCLSALILGCKVWEEHPVFNTDFGDLFPEMSGKLLGQLEKMLLNLLKFEVGLTGTEYAQYYFELRDLSPKAFASYNSPLTDEEVARLEERSADSREWASASRSKPAVTQSANFDQTSRKRGELVVEKRDADVAHAQATAALGRWQKEAPPAAPVNVDPLPASSDWDDDEDED